ncbi:MAG: flavodoxin family protein [Verrucomicrobiae bacterium]|nr:flavodoxin family protein [Verrucomicrobiae bacterium]
MKIVALLGSPRAQGNSAFIMEHFLKAAARLGAETRTFALNALRYRGCQACYACKKTADQCVLRDDLAEVLDAVREADVLALASPVYYGDVTSQMKAFIDRTYAYFTPEYITNPANRSRLKPGKKFVMVLTQGHPDEKTFADIFPRYTFFMQMYGMGEFYLIRACGLAQPDAVRSRKDVLDKAGEVAARVCNLN